MAALGPPILAGNIVIFWWSLRFQLQFRHVHAEGSRLQLFCHNLREEKQSFWGHATFTEGHWSCVSQAALPAAGNLYQGFRSFATQSTSSVQITESNEGITLPTWLEWQRI